MSLYINVTYLLPNYLFYVLYLLSMLEDVSFLERSKIRVTVMQNLEKPSTPTRSSKLLKLHRSAISRAILELEGKDFVKCLNPSDRRARFYQITDKGKKLLKKYQNLN